MELKTRVKYVIVIISQNSILSIFFMIVTTQITRSMVNGGAAGSKGFQRPLPGSAPPAHEGAPPSEGTGIVAAVDFLK